MHKLFHNKNNFVQKKQALLLFIYLGFMKKALHSLLEDFAVMET